MPKLRKDLQTNANQIDWRIETVGKPAVLQIRPRRTYFVVEFGRPRLPPLRLEGYKGANNLMYIPAGCVLDSQWRQIYPNHYMSQFVEDSVLRMKWGIITRGDKHLVRTYDVVNGLAFARRRADHILAGYQEELRDLTNTLTEIERALNGPTFLSSERELQGMHAAIAKIQLRQGAIQRILSERVVRDVNLHFAYEKASFRLIQWATISGRWANQIRATPGQIRLRSIQDMTNSVLAEMPFFASKEIRSQIKNVREAFIRVATREPSEFADLKFGQSLGQVSAVLFYCADLLETEAWKLPEGERIAADQIRSGRF